MTNAKLDALVKERTAILAENLADSLEREWAGQDLATAADGMSPSQEILMARKKLLSHIKQLLR